MTDDPPHELEHMGALTSGFHPPEPREINICCSGHPDSVVHLVTVQTVTDNRAIRHLVNLCFYFFCLNRTESLGRRADPCLF